MKGAGLRYLISTLLILLIWSAAALAGTELDNLFHEANEAYSRGDYDQAIGKYELITATKGYAPGVLYNLANSYALSGKPGKAILNYERALRLSPADSDIIGNLELIQKENGLFPPEPSTAEQFFQILSLNQWTTLIPLALVLFTSYLLASMKYRFPRQRNIGMGIFCVLLLTLGTAGIFFRLQTFNPSVVVTADAKILLSPFASSAPIGTLPEGRLVYLQKKHGTFSYVTDEMDRQGWIDSSRIEPLYTSTPSDF